MTQLTSDFFVERLKAWGVTPSLTGTSARRRSRLTWPPRALGESGAASPREPWS